MVGGLYHRICRFSQITKKWEIIRESRKSPRMRKLGNVKSSRLLKKRDMPQRHEVARSRTKLVIPTVTSLCSFVSFCLYGFFSTLPGPRSKLRGWTFGFPHFGFPIPHFRFSPTGTPRPFGGDYRHGPICRVRPRAGASRQERMPMPTPARSGFRYE